MTGHPDPDTISGRHHKTKSCFGQCTNRRIAKNVDGHQGLLVQQIQTFRRSDPGAPRLSHKGGPNIHDLPTRLHHPITGKPFWINDFTTETKRFFVCEQNRGQANDDDRQQ